MLYRLLEQISDKGLDKFLKILISYQKTTLGLLTPENNSLSNSPTNPDPASTKYQCSLFAGPKSPSPADLASTAFGHNTPSCLNLQSAKDSPLSS